MNSDPGTSGLLSPFAKIDGLYFNSEEEPNDFYYQLVQDLEQLFKEDGYTVIHCEFDSPESFYAGLEALEHYASEHIHVSGTSREGRYEVVINEEGDMDDPTKPSTIALAKKKKKKPEELEA